jgi:hypothetical protein
LHETARDGLAISWSDLIEVAAQDRLQNGVRGHARNPESQGALHDEEDREKRADCERPDENAGTLE